MTLPALVIAAAGADVMRPDGSSAVGANASVDGRETDMSSSDALLGHSVLLKGTAMVLSSVSTCCLGKTATDIILSCGEKVNRIFWKTTSR